MEYYSLNEHHFNSYDLHQIVKRLKRGETIIFPTDTIYALGCSIHSKSGIDSICKLSDKKRETANLSIICSSFKEITTYSKPMSNKVFKIMKTHLPGPYTFILEADQKIKRLFGSKKKTVGIRVPNNNITLKIIEELGHPLVSTSLHSEDEVQQFLTEPDEIIERYNKKVDLFVDDGAGDNIGSTVIDCSSDEIEILREGKGEI